MAAAGASSALGKAAKFVIRPTAVPVLPAMGSITCRLQAHAPSAEILSLSALPA